MKATKAYIASLGTTGVLLGASILMLAVVSAVVAFDRWPDGNISTRVQTLVIDDRPAAIRVSDASTAPSATPGTPVAAAVAAAGGIPVTVAPVQRRAGENQSGGSTPPAAGGTPNPGTPPADPVPAQVPDPSPIINALSNPDTTAGRVADGTETLAAGVGVSLGRLSPALGSAVAGTGQVAAQTLRSVPLPDNILPQQ